MRWWKSSAMYLRGLPGSTEMTWSRKTVPMRRVRCEARNNRIVLYSNRVRTGIQIRIDQQLGAAIPGIQGDRRLG